MKRIFPFIAATLLTATALTAQTINPNTAWWNNETFESYAVETNLKNSTTDPAGTVWTGNQDVLIQTLSGATTGSASGNVLGLSLKSDAAFPGSISAGGERTISKTFTNVLSSRFIYIKTSYYHATIGTDYILKDDAGNIVFQFGGLGAKDGPAVTFTGKTAAEIGLGKRDQWSDLELILDLTSNKIVKIVASNSSLTKKSETFSDISLPTTHNKKINSLTVKTYKGYAGSGLDNITIGELLADNIINLIGENEIQTMSSQVNNTYSVKALANVSSLGIADMEIEGGKSNIIWTIADYGTLPEDEKTLIGINRSESNHAEAVLTTSGAVSADASITIQAVLGATTLTKTVSLKAVNLTGLKDGLLNEISTASALDDGVSGSIVPYLTGISGTLANAISTAQGVYDDSSISDPELIATAITNLQAAEAVFTTALTAYNNYVAYIATVQAAHNAEVRAATFIANAKSTLQTAITAAEGTTATTSEGLDTDKATLTTALNTFTAAQSSYSIAATAVTDANAKLVTASARIGTQFLNFLQADIDTYSAAIAQATTNLDTSSDISDISATLASAYTTLYAARVAPSGKYQIFTYGVLNGDYGSEAQKKLVYIDGTTMKYTTATSADNDLWIITETSDNVYTVQNEGTGKFLNNNSVVDEAANFTFTENKTQAGLIKFDDAYYLYSMRGTSYVEVSTWDVETSTGIFKTNSAIADRARFCFQFEQESPTTENKSIENTSLKVYVSNNKAIIDGIEPGKTYSIFNALGANIASDKASSTKTEIALPTAGLYIVKVSNQTFKLIR